MNGGRIKGIHSALAQCAPYFDRHIFEAFVPDAV